MISYLFRLDDACPHHHRAAWARVEALFDAAGVKPLVALVPDCQDPDFDRYPVDAQFWPRALQWQAKGWLIGLHGFQHRFRTTKRGLVPINAYSEFAGLPLSEQLQMIKSGAELLVAKGLRPRAWIAPAHSFDRNTLRALAAQTEVRLISDGLATSPFRRFGFVWVPQQLWRPRKLKRGVWTICLHPNELSDGAFEELERFLAEQRPNLGDWSSLVPPPAAPSGPTLTVRRFNLVDYLFGLAFLVARTLKHQLRRTSSYAAH